MQRTATVERKTNETTISLSLNIDGEGKVKVDTGFGMADHMLSLMFFWAGFNLDLSCKGDMNIDAHHTIEDIGICIGKALDSALGDKKGISRTAFAKVPMDEALADVSIDLSGRPYLVFCGKELLPPIIAGEECDVWREFYRAFSTGAKMNLHITLVYGQNGHHMLESISKGLGLALRSAVAINRNTLLSTKGSLD